MATLRLEIATAERLVYAEDVDVVVAPGIDGELAVLPSHAPLLTELKPGELRVVKGGEESLIALSGGFMEVMGDKVAILADTAEHSDEIDLDRAEAALAQARNEISSAQSSMDLERAMVSMRRSQARLRVAGRRRRDTGGARPSA